ncbi:hypothetical protein TSH58p_00580 (plasmid) [Azospirillum sp. TSH58]|uniref:DUF2934 domain-containing protein n=1 Tax=Azospirillum sp. TSH58 TaxID=664962 RepID=UPI000D5FED68|nr:DUF2934 domain-containing protein [Azospirillum sp. TSH58]AWJ82077.1 hypothetical protein TSH58p_00580 [Azospirillum sp. TSH58]PWC62300.1 hypothetical protein TSH58_25530 [Azospirillum sp. TSH58]
MQGDREDRIRHRAYEIWERDGRPEGRGEEHWAQACAEIEAEDRTAATAEPVAMVAAVKDAAAGAVKKAVRRTKTAATELLGVGLNAVVDVVEEAVATKKPRARKAKAEPAPANDTLAAAPAETPAAAKAAKPPRAKAVKAEAAKPAAPRTRRKPVAPDTEPAH